jgi:hypothetical protein
LLWFLIAIKESHSNNSRATAAAFSLPIDHLDQSWLKIRCNPDLTFDCSVLFHHVPTYTRWMKPCQAHNGTVWHIYFVEEHRMALVRSLVMAKKTEFIRIRVDTELKQALDDEAHRQDRQEADQARHLLRKALGLVVSEKEPDYSLKVAKVPDTKTKKGGGEGGRRSRTSQ